MQAYSKSWIFKLKIFVATMLSPSPYLLTIESLSIQQALLSPHWKKAMEEEYATLIRNKTWILEPLFVDKAIGCK